MNLGISNLQHLNLQGNDPETYADNLRWLSGLSSPEFLELSNLALSKAFDWLEVINIFPSLAELRIFFLTRLSLQYPTGYILSAILSSSNLGATIFKVKIQVPSVT
jgi:hypothetical protein